MSNLDRLETLNQARHAAEGAFLEARRAYVSARVRTENLKAEERAARGPAAWDLGHVYDAAVTEQNDATRAADRVLKRYLSALDAFFAELDGVAEDPPVPW